MGFSFHLTANNEGKHQRVWPFQEQLTCNIFTQPVLLSAELAPFRNYMFQMLYGPEILSFKISHPIASKYRFGTFSFRQRFSFARKTI